MYIVKVILMPLLKNMSHQKVYILILFVVDGKVGKSTLLKETSNKLNLFKKQFGKSIYAECLGNGKNNIFFQEKDTQLSLA